MRDPMNPKQEARELCEEIRLSECLCDALFCEHVHTVVESALARAYSLGQQEEREQTNCSQSETCTHSTVSLADNWKDRYCVNCGKWMGKEGEFYLKEDEEPIG